MALDHFSLSKDEILDKIISWALEEDSGPGDHSALACIPSHANGAAQLLVKEDCVVAGLELAELIFRKVDKEIIFEVFTTEGSFHQKGDVIFKVKGKSQGLLKSERIVLNFMQRMSAIATETARYVKELEGTKTKVLDTRKTTPGLRFIEKWAVAIGGGKNHRMGLYDMIMLKDNHIDFCGGIEKAIQKTQTYLKENKLNIPIEVEARNLEEVDEILKAGGVHRIMLDNFSIEDTKTAVGRIGNLAETESSGGITLKNLREYADCGVDFISVGALTHGVKNVDLSLKAID